MNDWTLSVYCRHDAPSEHRRCAENFAVGGLMDPRLCTCGCHLGNEAA